MQTLPPKALDALVTAVTTAYRAGCSPVLAPALHASARASIVRRDLAHATQEGLQFTDQAVGIAEAEIERREHEANEEAARPAMQAAADRALVDRHQGQGAPDFAAVWNAGHGTHYADPAALRPLCGKPQVFAPLNVEVACRRCIKARKRREEDYASVVAARTRLGL